MSEDSCDEANSILLNDSRTGQLSADEQERQFLVGQDEEDDYEEVRSVSSAATSDIPGDEDERPNSGLGLMSNQNARMSHLDVHTGGNPGFRKQGSGLAAKAGIILVGILQMLWRSLQLSASCTGYPQYFYRAAAICYLWHLFHHLRSFRCRKVGCRHWHPNTRHERHDARRQFDSCWT